MPNTQNVQNVQNVQNIHNYQPAAPGQAAQTQAPQMQTTQMQPTQTQPTQTQSTQVTPVQNSTPMQRDWSSEISLPEEDGTATQPPSGAMRPAMFSELAGSSGSLDLQNHVPDEVMEAPTTVAENYLGSMKSMLNRNKGNFVVATFLIGTQGTTTWEGLLYEVGNDYLIIHQLGRDRYIACDLYSLKYIEFYDTQRKRICDSLMWQNGWQSCQ